MLRSSDKIGHPAQKREVLQVRTILPFGTTTDGELHQEEEASGQQPFLAVNSFYIVCIITIMSGVYWVTKVSKSPGYIYIMKHSRRGLLLFDNLIEMVNKHGVIVLYFLR